MWDDLATAKPGEILELIGLIAGMGFCAMVPLVWIFGKTVALNENPDRRAIWTAGLSYAVASIIITLFGGSLLSLIGPLVPLPAAGIMYYWLRSTYRKGWVEDHLVTEEMSIENSDWRVGAGLVATTIIAAALKMLFLKAAG